MVEEREDVGGVFCFEATDYGDDDHDECNFRELMKLNLYNLFPTEKNNDPTELEILARISCANKVSVMGAFYYIEAARRRDPSMFLDEFRGVAFPNLFLAFLIIANKFLFDNAKSNGYIATNLKSISVEDLNALEMRAFRCLHFSAGLNILLLESVSCSFRKIHL